MNLTDKDIRVKAEAFYDSLVDGTFRTPRLENSGTEFKRAEAESKVAFFREVVNSGVFDVAGAEENF